MGASYSSLSSFHPSSLSLKEKEAGVSTTMSQPPSLSHPRVHLNSPNPPSGILKTRKPPNSHIQYPVTFAQLASSEQNLWTPSRLPKKLNSSVYPTVSTNQTHPSTRSPIDKPASRIQSSSPHVPVPRSEQRQVLQNNATLQTRKCDSAGDGQKARLPTKSGSKSSLGSNSKISSSFREAPPIARSSLRHGDLSSTSRDVHKTVDRRSSFNSSRSRTQGKEDIRNGALTEIDRKCLGPINELASGDEHVRTRTSNHFPRKPPGLGSVPKVASQKSLRLQTSPPPRKVVLDSQTKRLSRLLEQSSIKEDALPAKYSQDGQSPNVQFTLALYLSDPYRLSSLLHYLTFQDWLSLFSTSKEIRMMLSQNELLKEEVLERFLKGVGYSRWVWRNPEPLILSLQDLGSFIRASSIPLPEYARVAESYLISQSLPEEKRDSTISDSVVALANCTRAYNRVVLRLRAQAEMLKIDVMNDNISVSGSCPSTPSSRRSSQYSHSSPSPLPISSSASFLSGSSSWPSHYQNQKTTSTGFCSPVYDAKRAVLLRVFVPSPQGEWLSDASVFECEAELKRAGLLSLVKYGDIVWDVALGDEQANVGKLIWDGLYLLDLDYSYSSSGDIPKHIHSLALPPSYFHGVIKAGPLNADPIMRMDVSPWGEEIARNLQLMQDRMVVAEMPQGGLKNAFRWVHRSMFTIKPPSRSRSPRGIPIPNSNGCLTVHPTWYGVVIIETDGTNESLEHLKECCGEGVFPKPVLARKPKDKSEKMVWRILRGKSRPGEIWVQVVSPRERIM